MSRGRESWWKAADWTRAKAMRAAGASYQDIADDLDMPYPRVAQKFHNEMHREHIEVGSAAGEHHRQTGPSPKQLIDREQRHLAELRRTQTQTFFGDPPPGYSALDKKRTGAARSVARPQVHRDRDRAKVFRYRPPPHRPRAAATTPAFAGTIPTLKTREI